MPKFLKGLDARRQKADEFANEVDPFDDMTREQRAAHVLRGRASYLDQGPGSNFTPSELALVDEYLNLRDYSYQGSSQRDEVSAALDALEEKIADLSYEHGPASIDKYIRETGKEIDRPLYVARTEGAVQGDFSDTADDSLHSVLAVDPENTQSYNYVYGQNPSKMYKLEPGTRVHNTGGLADQDEGIVTRGDLNKAQSMDLSEYISHILKGSAPFGIAAAMMQPNGAEASNENLSRTPPPPQDLKAEASNDDFFRNTLPQDLEAIASLGTGALAEILSGYAGIAGKVLPGPPTQVRDWVEGTQEALTYKPNNPESLESIAGLAEWPMEMYERGTDWLGDTTLDLTGSPGAAALAKASPEILGGGLALRQLLKGAPRVRTPNKERPPELDEPDTSRRKFIRNAAMGTAGAALAGKTGLKGLLDVDAAPTAAKTAATAAAKSAVPNMITATPNGLRLATLAKAFPEFDLKTALKRRLDGEDMEQVVFERYADLLNDVSNNPDAKMTLDELIEMDKVINESLSEFSGQEMLEAYKMLRDQKTSNIQLDLGSKYDKHINNQDIGYGDWIQGGNALDNIDNMASEMRYQYDTSFGDFYDPISGDRAVFSDNALDSGPTMEYSEGTAKPLKIYKDYKDYIGE